ncbi:LmbE-like protein [Mycobacteroides abscessus subsp. abscessus]|nr:LmbE-like protein [Mycobacteroides abscessus subsp. abscessus]
MTVNRLGEATSPYLRQHVDNPVHWQQWNPEALAEAQSRDVPILLSIGYAACHWCHVMAHESFEDDEVAAVMNAGFVNIKVDREERPDLDAVYMNATVAMNGQGGWPMTCFLTPDGRPFYTMRARMQLLNDECKKHGYKGPFDEWLERWPADDDTFDRRVTTRVPCADFFDARDAALRAHASQIPPDSSFFAVPREFERKLWPTEDFELAKSRVPTSTPEDDLFAGVEIK